MKQNNKLTFEGLLTIVNPRRVENMNDQSLEKLEASVSRLLVAYSSLKAENSGLRGQLSEIESKQALFKERLDNLIARLEADGGT